MAYFESLNLSFHNRMALLDKEINSPFNLIMMIYIYHLSGKSTENLKLSNSINLDLFYTFFSI